jgi:hypothetical protein
MKQPVAEQVRGRVVGGGRKGDRRYDTGHRDPDERGEPQNPEDLRLRAAPDDEGHRDRDEEVGLDREVRQKAAHRLTAAGGRGPVDDVLPREDEAELEHQSNGRDDQRRGVPVPPGRHLRHTKDRMPHGASGRGRRTDEGTRDLGRAAHGRHGQANLARRCCPATAAWQPPPWCPRQQKVAEPVPRQLAGTVYRASAAHADELTAFR